ncbi:Uncharacterised protein [Vibrio cholerae]|nr:Uncharacterised protein [Vibrio cholerae]
MALSNRHYDYRAYAARARKVPNWLRHRHQNHRRL